MLWGGNTVTTPLIWGGVATSLTDQQYSSEYEQAVSGSTANDTWSIQGNTNGFACSFCQSGFPVPLSESGDSGWVQFVYQNSGLNPGTNGGYSATVRLAHRYLGGLQANGHAGRRHCRRLCTILRQFAQSGHSQSPSERVLPGDFPRFSATFNADFYPALRAPAPTGASMDARIPGQPPEPGWWAALAPGQPGPVRATGPALRAPSMASVTAARPSSATPSSTTTVVANSCYTSHNAAFEPSTISSPPSAHPARPGTNLDRRVGPTHGDGTGESNNLTPCDATFSSDEYLSSRHLTWSGDNHYFCDRHDGELRVRSFSSYGDSLTFTATVAYRAAAAGRFSAVRSGQHHR